MLMSDLPCNQNAMLDIARYLSKICPEKIRKISAFQGTTSLPKG